MAKGCELLKNTLTQIADGVGGPATGSERMLAAVTYAIMEDVASDDADAVQRAWRAISGGLRSMSEQRVRRVNPGK